MATGSTVANTAQGAQRLDLQFGATRQLADGSYSSVSSSAAVWNYKNLTASGTTVVKTGAGQLFGWFCGTATGNITIYDNTAASGSKVLDACALVAGLNQLPVSFGTGVTVVLSGAGVVTLLYL